MFKIRRNFAPSKDIKDNIINLSRGKQDNKLTHAPSKEKKG